MATKREKERRWLPIDGYEGSYEISDFGEVRSLERFRKNKKPEDVARVHSRMLAKYFNSDGYPIVVLWKNGRGRTLSVHSLVAFAFLIKETADLEVNHKDGDKSNCHVSNLEWVTRKENARHAYSTGLRKRGEEAPTAKLNDADVREIRQLLSEGALSRRQIGKIMGVTGSTINFVANGKTWTHVK